MGYLCRGARLAKIPLMDHVIPDGRGGASEQARYQPLVVVLVAACGGVVADRYLAVALPAWWTIATAAWAAWFVAWQRRYDRAATLPLLAAIAATAGSWHHCCWCLFDADDLGRYARTAPQPVLIEAVAIQSPRAIAPPAPDPMMAFSGGPRCRLKVAMKALRDGQDWCRASGLARLDVQGHLAHVQAGDRLRIFAQLTAPLPPQNPGDFDAAGFFRAERVRSRLKAESDQAILVIAKAGICHPRRLLESLRSYGNQILAQHLTPRRQALAASVLLGRREQLEPERKEAFLETGTIHILSISGLHVGVLAAAMIFVVQRTRLAGGRGLALVAALIAGYAVLVDVEAPVVRATVLVIVACWSLYLGRRPLGFNSLAAGALVVLAIRPLDLFNIGAQLSFLSAAGLVAFAPWWTYSTGTRDPLKRLIRENQPWPTRAIGATGRYLGRLTLVSAAIGLLTLPLVMARFHLLSPVALVLNPLVSVPMSVGLIAGFATLVLGSLAWPLGQLSGLVCEGSFWLLETCVALGQRCPASHFWLPGPPDWWLAVLYLALGAVAAFPRLKPPRRWCVVSAAVWIAVGLGVSHLHRDTPHLRCTVLSVGHGCAVLVELPDRQKLLYDAGRLGSPFVAERSIATCLWSRGITHLDAVVLSHCDLDHFNALPGLLEKFSVQTVYVSPVMFRTSSAALESLRIALEQSGCCLAVARAGEQLWACREGTIEVLHPPSRGRRGSDNANSVVLAIEHQGRRILLPGDLENPGLEDLMAGRPFDCDVLLAPHHGSQRSNVPALRRWSSPEWVIISGGHRSHGAATADAYRVAGCEVLGTADVGAVEVRVFGGQIAVSAPYGGTGDF